MNKKFCLLALLAIVAALPAFAQEKAAPPQPDPQMQAVLDQLAALGGEPSSMRLFAAEVMPHFRGLQPPPGRCVEAISR